MNVAVARSSVEDLYHFSVQIPAGALLCGSESYYRGSVVRTADVVARALRGETVDPLGPDCSRSENAGTNRQTGKDTNRIALREA